MLVVVVREDVGGRGRWLWRMLVVVVREGIGGGGR